MRPSRPLAAPAQRARQIALLRTLATEHSVWLDHLGRKYNRLRVELIALLAAPGALEREIAMLISDAARERARELLQSREWPDSVSPELFDRAVYGHWKRLRDAEMQANLPALAELKSVLQ